ncbi:DNA-binding transcriptional regulator, AcrR family [Duganella sacchari]|uniref:DNA-binding transcriptional regulator, AcrR family n=1 Tax=Duganella sacchari TaxID=551987 RepID=A0A1M7RBK0_9BURK|nr:TetR/AcrR family transcriptional regulator [Duganella sacchari]SHN43664.1 DNA-binding transcriptional regulator, AcrR family [Duganella sacchari]
MNNSQSRKAAARGLAPRKAPSQSRSAQTVETILEGAAHILEQLGLEGYTTNAIAAKAGVSIGSLYQYFPSKDAVTIALIERESSELVREAKAALLGDDRRSALRQLIEIAVRYQLRRPRLAKLLDFEQDRLAPLLPTSGNVATLHTALVDFLNGWPGASARQPQVAASDLMAIMSALTDSAGRRGTMDAAKLANSIEGAVLGYLAETTTG